MLNGLSIKKNNYIGIVLGPVMCLIGHIHGLKCEGKEVQSWNACTQKDHIHFNKNLCWIFSDRIFFVVPTQEA